jgi:hypothetical protein
VNKLIQAAALGIVGLGVLATSSRALIALAESLVTPLAVCAVLAALLRCVWFFTGPR